MIKPKRKETKKVININVEKPKIQQIICKCGKSIDMNIYGDKWYIFSDFENGCNYWECGFIKK